MSSCSLFNISSLISLFFFSIQLQHYRQSNLIPYDIHLLWSNKLWPDFAESIVYNYWANLAADLIISLRDDPHSNKTAEHTLKQQLILLLITLVGDLRSIKINGIVSPTSSFAISQVNRSPFLGSSSFFIITLYFFCQCWTLVNNRIKCKRDVASRKRQKLCQISPSGHTSSPPPLELDESDPTHMMLHQLIQSEVSLCFVLIFLPSFLFSFYCFLTSSLFHYPVSDHRPWR